MVAVSNSLANLEAAAEESLRFLQSTSADQLPERVKDLSLSIQVL